jgi:hypothetical protein
MLGTVTSNRNRKRRNPTRGGDVWGTRLQHQSQKTTPGASLLVRLKWREAAPPFISMGPTAAATLPLSPCRKRSNPLIAGKNRRRTKKQVRHQVLIQTCDGISTCIGEDCYAVVFSAASVAFDDYPRPSPRRNVIPAKSDSPRKGEQRGRNRDTLEPQRSCHSQSDISNSTGCRT